MHDKGGILLKTKITLVTGEKYLLDGSPEDFVKDLQNESGVIVNKYITVAPQIYVNTSHIVKIEKDIE